LEGYAVAADPNHSFESLIANAPRLVPVLHVENADHAEPLLEALTNAGIVALEVTLRTAAALKVIERMSKIGGPAIVGAGTVTRRGQFAQVKNAGARFVVSPALTPELAEGAYGAGLPYLPGVATPTEALRARELGFLELKFFPADLMGGVGFLKHVAPLYPELRFCPTGGISDKNVKDYLSQPNCLAAGGGYLAPRALIDAADWKAIGDGAAKSVAAAR
jgi:2-dehydro-3-deoxyphosphogluconate aldolase/(4S)-4-hydroxy-2-oxoglutarate aldolase